MKKKHRKFPNRKISETFLEFSSPLLDAIGQVATKDQVQKVLQITYSVWNSIVFDTVRGSEKNISMLREAIKGDQMASAMIELTRGKKMPDTIVSPNDWFKKSGVTITDDDNLQLPIRDLILPMHHASTSIERYEKEKDLPQTMDVFGKLQLIQNIGINVRAADKAYFNLWSSALIRNNINNEAAVLLFGGCKNCLQASLSPNSLREHVAPKLKELSDLNNNKIIHAMDSGGMIKESDAHIVFEYYNEFLNFNLMYFPEIKSLKKRKCKQCMSKQQHELGL